METTHKLSISQEKQEDGSVSLMIGYPPHILAIFNDAVVTFLRIIKDH